MVFYPLLTWALDRLGRGDLLDAAIPTALVMATSMTLGMAAAAGLLDAAVIRCLMVPAIMQLLGERAWWLPRWLDRMLPAIALERQPGPRTT
jgi:uncharacterized membrane protein YdfJ with MMPL/SSD domain